MDKMNFQVKEDFPDKIHITGSVASGKTTLAKKLSRQFMIPCYELDNVVWKRHENGDSKRTEEERKEYLDSILSSETWIIEGVHQEEWVSESFRLAELIILLDTNYKLRTYRIIKRFFFQKIGWEKSNYEPTFKIFFKMFAWNKYYEKIGKPKFFKNTDDYREKTIVMKSEKDFDKLVKILKGLRA